MKILVTGMTLGQSGKPPEVGYITFSACLVRMLRDTGHEVVTRSVKVGEDLDEFDLIICGVISPFSVAAKFIYPALDLLARYWLTGRRPMISYIDDWEMWSVDQNSRSALRDMRRIIRPSVFARRPSYDWAVTREGQDAMRKVFEQATESGFPPAVFPAFGWGNPEPFRRYVTAEDYWFLDPACYTPRHDFTARESWKRRRAWVLAVIKTHTDYADRLPASWEVVYIGGGGRMTRKTHRIPVQDVVQEYADCWGVLSPFYRKLAGTGWWRERMLHAAMTRSVLLCDPREAPQLGEPYAHPLHEIEAMTSYELEDLAEAQASALRAGCWQPDKLHEETAKMLEAAINHGS